MEHNEAVSFLIGKMVTKWINNKCGVPVMVGNVHNEDQYNKHFICADDAKLKKIKLSYNWMHDFCTSIPVWGYSRKFYKEFLSHNKHLHRFFKNYEKNNNHNKS